MNLGVYGMKKGILIVIVVAMFGWAIYDFIQSDEKSVTSVESDKAENDEANQETTNEKEDERPVGLEVGNLAPDFELQTLTGEQIRLSDLRGQRVMINFWATWCPPCRAEMPDMEEFYQDKDVEILAVDLTATETSVEDVEAFVAEYDLSFPILLDEHTEVASLYRIQPIPTSFMVDSDGVVQYQAYGAINYDIMVQEFEKMN